MRTPSASRPRLPPGPSLFARVLRPLTAGFFALALALLATGAEAQAWPAKPIRLIIPFPAGGALDSVGRVAAAALSERLAVQVVVDNRGGASGAIGVADGAHALPDGYTLIFASSDTVTILPLLRRDLPFDVARDLSPVAKLADSFLMIAVHPSVPAQSIQELIALARSRPGALRYASPGAGTVHQISFEYFNLLAGTQITHVPFKGGSAATAAVMGGHVEVLITGFNVHKAVLGGQLRGLAVAKPTRSPLMPEIPTMAQSGIADYTASSWFGIFGPAGLPEAIRSRLGRELMAIASTEDFQQHVIRVGGDAEGIAGDDFVRYLKRESERWQRIIALTHVQLDN
jgi:tripartite-type tricarboxylate transporter receptor subunit TctC